MNTKTLKKIGQGAFSTVWKKDNKTVLIKSSDNVKVCFSLGWCGNSRLFPKLKRIMIDDDFSFYECKFYEKVSSLKNNLLPEEYAFYLELRKFSACFGMDYYKLYDLFNALPAQYNGKKKALLSALEGLINYGSDICFEISPRNVAVEKGELILLDCFFFRSQLKAKMKMGK